jgi:hypothetical protein
MRLWKCDCKCARTGGNTMFVSRREVLARGLASGAILSLPAGPARAVPAALAALAGYVGQKLLDGALEYIGGKIMASALGDPVLSDVRSWVAAAVAEIEAFVSAELKRQLDALTIEEMQADLQAVNTSLYQYADLKKASRKLNRYLLETSDTATARLIPLSLNFDQALYITTAAMGFRLFVILGLFQLDNDAGHIKSARPTMDDFVKKTVVIRDRVAAAMDPKVRISATDCGFTHIGEPPHQILVTKCEVTGDGVVKSYFKGGGNLDEANAWQRSIVKGLTATYLAQQKAFTDNVNQSVSKAIVCFDKMCRLIGETYAPPPDAGFVKVDLKPLSAFVGATIRMPGATIRLTGS